MKGRRAKVWDFVATFTLVLVILASTLSVGWVTYQVYEIRGTLNCHTQALDAVLKDAKLAFAGDKRASDYSKAPVCD